MGLTAIDLGNLGGTRWNLPFYINNQGKVVGQSGVPGGIAFHAFLWQNGVMTDLGTLPGDIWSWASNINSKNQAVGTSFPEIGSRAFLWQNGVMTDLNTLIPAGFAFYLAEAFGINDRGEIAGFGVLSDGHTRPFLLIPCGEGAEGCGNSAVGATATAETNPAAVTQRPANATPANPALIGRGMLDRLRARRFPWRRPLGPATGPAN
jgi:probable HAF family extracellular repeat protein